MESWFNDSEALQCKTGAAQVRQVIVHYHIFKNAGSTLDHMLEKTFGDRWANFDKDLPTSRINAAELAAYIQANTSLAAISSHHAMLPAPEITDVEIIPVLFVRHPLDRVRSVYEFERQQGIKSGPISRGAEHAAKLSFHDYLRWRFDSTQNGVVHNHQTVWMIHHPRYQRHPIADEEFELAWSRLKGMPFFGLVEHFDDSIALLQSLLVKRGINFATEYQAKNQNEQREGDLEKRLASMRAELGERMWLEVIARNKFDLMLYNFSLNEFGLRSSNSAHE